MYKFNKLIILIILSSLNLFSQPVLDNTHLPQIGDKYSYSECDTVGLNPGNKGANQTWDFSNVKKLTSYSFNVINPSAGIKKELFPDATVAFQQDTATQYYKISNNKMERLGMGFADGEEILQNFETVIQVPFTYNDKITDSFSGLWTVKVDGELYDMRSAGTIQIDADAWGNLKLPQGEFSNVLRTMSTRKEYDTMTVMGYNMFRSITVISYQWFSNNEKFPLFSLSYVTETQIVFGQTTTTSMVSVQISDAKPNGGNTVTPPSLQSPANGATGLTIPVRLEWNPVTKIDYNKNDEIQANTEYTVEYADNPGFSPVISSVPTTDTYIEISNIDKGKTYYWHVKAKVDDKESNWSNSFSFTTETESSVDELYNGENSFTITPNPASTFIQIKYSDEINTIDKLELINLNGALVKEIQNPNNNLEISVGDISSGKYIIRITSGNNIYINTLNILR